MARAVKYASVQESFISPEGTFPAVGRSLAYRFGAFQTLSQVALMEKLPAEINPAQVRCALTAVIKKIVESKGTFDADGWLQIGFAGHQPGIGEKYISTGSLYLCTVGMVVLGLPEQNNFWAAPPENWTSKKIYQGMDVLKKI